MRFILILFTLFPLLFFCKKNCDTLVVKITPSSQISEYSPVFQKSLNTKTSKVLKILVKAGNYNLSSSISTTKNNTVIIFEKNANVYFTANNNSGILVIHDYCTISNGNFFGNGISTDNFYKGFGVLVNGANHCIIKNNKFNKISGINIFLYPKSGTIGCSNNLIDNNSISQPVMNIDESTGSFGILLGYSGVGYTHDNNVVSNNVVDGAEKLKIGIAIIGHGNDNIIINNQVKNLKHYGIVSYESKDFNTTLNRTQVLNNTVSNIGESGLKKTVFGMGIYVMQSNNSTISGNKVYDTLKNSDETETLGAGSISVGMSPDSFIENNEIENSNMYGIVCSYSDKTIIKNNMINNVRKSAIYLISDDNITISENKINNIGEVVFKGNFESGYGDNIKALWKNTSKYINKSTGNNIVIKNNTINSSEAILFFTGKSSKIQKEVNLIQGNSFENNIITGNSKPINELIFYRNSIENKNYIRNNMVKR